MIHRISVTVTQRGLQFNAKDIAGQPMEPLWLSASDTQPGRLEGKLGLESGYLQAWHLSDALFEQAQALIMLAARLVRSLRLGQLPRMHALTFDIMHSGVDCHVSLSSSEEVLVHYPLPIRESSVRPAVHAGELSSLPSAFLTVFHQAVKTRLCPLARELSYTARSQRPARMTEHSAKGQDAA